MMRMHGSIMPKLILPITFVAGWSTCITLISRFVYDSQYPLTMALFLS
jgi:predicted membrane chloride channel (bestrophin family)